MAKTKQDAKAPAKATKATKKHGSTTQSQPSVRKVHKKNKNHVFTLKQRNVIYILLSQDQFRMPLKRATEFFNHIFRGELPRGSITAAELRKDWGGRDKPKGTAVYRNRICKRKGQFTNVEIKTRVDAMQDVDDAAEALEHDQALLSVDLGPPIDAPPAKAPSTLYGQTHLLDGKRLPVGYQVTPRDWVEPNAEWDRTTSNLDRKAMIFDGTYTRAMVLTDRTRTPSATPVLVHGQFQHVPRAVINPNLNNQAQNQIQVQNQNQIGDQNGSQNGDENGHPYGEPDETESQDQDQGDGHDMDGAVGGAEAADEDNGLTTIQEEEESADDQVMQTTEESPAHASDFNGMIDPALLDNENAMLGQRNSPDATIPDTTINPFLPNQSNATLAQQNMPTQQQHTDVTAQPGFAALPDEAKQQFEHRQRLLREVYNHILLLPPHEAAHFFQVASPELTYDAAAQLTLNTNKQIEDAWFQVLNACKNPPMFELHDALTSTDSPLNFAYTSRLRMFHVLHLNNSWNGTAYNVPAYLPILPSDPLYKRGGPVIRADTAMGTQEDIMACNVAFCNICGTPPTHDHAFDLQNIPFVHYNSLDYSHMIHRQGEDPDNVFFINDQRRDIGRVAQDGARIFCKKVTFADGVVRPAWVCHAVQCERCGPGGNGAGLGGH